jgi:hypothetical protein
MMSESTMTTEQHEKEMLQLLEQARKLYFEAGMDFAMAHKALELRFEVLKEIARLKGLLP